MEKLYDIMPKKKKLQIVKYNKKVQNRLDLGIKDYKEYSETFTPIEIEIIPVKGKYGEFIKVDENDRLIVDNTITLDLNGKTLTYDPSDSVVKDKNSPNDYRALITIIDNWDLIITWDWTINWPIDPLEGKKFDGRVVISVQGSWKLKYLNGRLNATWTGSDGMYGVYIFDKIYLLFMFSIIGLGLVLSFSSLFSLDVLFLDSILF